MARASVTATGLLAIVCLVVPPTRGAVAGEHESVPAAVTFSGEVARGQPFEHVIDGDVVFRLVPDAEGWTIFVGRPATPDEDWSGMMTPPFHGINARNIAGWHFRNADNTAANAPGAGSVNAPGHVRDFAFVRNTEDYRSAAHAVEALLYGTSEQDREAGQEAWDALEGTAARGRLTIVDLTLGNLEPGRHAWIERMRFEVTLGEP
jgi:hypothetical protein